MNPAHATWTEKEDQIIRDKYPRYGQCCMEHLPGRTLGAVQRRASTLGVGLEGVNTLRVKGNRKRTRDCIAKQFIQQLDYWENRE